jgi:hypothetical protein
VSIKRRHARLLPQVLPPSVADGEASFRLSSRFRSERLVPTVDFGARITIAVATTNGPIAVSMDQRPLAQWQVRARSLRLDHGLWFLVRQLEARATAPLSNHLKTLNSRSNPS